MGTGHPEISDIVNVKVVGFHELAGIPWKPATLSVRAVQAGGECTAKGDQGCRWVRAPAPDLILLDLQSPYGRMRFCSAAWEQHRGDSQCSFCAVFWSAAVKPDSQMRK